MTKNRAEVLCGRTIEQVRGECDADGIEWTVLVLDNGWEILIQEEPPWVIVEPQVN